MALPSTHVALVQEKYGQPLVLKTVPTPSATSGSAVIKIEAAPILSYMRDIYNGKRQYAYPTPLVPGTNAIGRVAATGPDAVLVKQGDLVYFDSIVRARDDAGAIILMGVAEGSTDASRTLMRGEWRDATFAEYAKVPLENIFPFDEKRLCSPTSNGGLNYSVEQLSWFMLGLVPYGGLRSIGLQAGETIIVAPATGPFGSAAAAVALAMGARVIAMGRNAEALAKLKNLSNRVETVQMLGDRDSEIAALKSFGPIDAYFDISPPEAIGATYFNAAILSLEHRGRVSYMGGFLEEVALPLRFIMRRDITLRGKWMYSREDNLSLLKLLATGVLDLHRIVQVMGTYALKDWKAALDKAAECARLGQMVMFKPSEVGG